VTAERRSILLVALVGCLCGMPASAGTLFTDLGSSPPIYDSGGWVISGSSSIVPVTQSVADLFRVSGSGSQVVSEIDLAVAAIPGSVLNTFTASIYTDNSGAPGVQVANAQWSPLNTNIVTCCALVTISGITGVTLEGGQSYYLVLGAVSPTDNSADYWAYNNQGVTGDVKVIDSGTSFDHPSSTLDAFAVLGGPAVPEPSSVLLIVTGLAGFLAARRRRP